MKFKEPARMQALLIIVLFGIAASGLMYFYNHPHLFTPSPAQAGVAVNSTCETDKVKVAPPAIPQFTWQQTGLITLWFDDGWISVYTAAFPALKSEGFTGAAAIPVYYVCKQGFVTWEQLRTLQTNGWETTSHSVTHDCKLQDYDDKSTAAELMG